MLGALQCANGPPKSDLWVEEGQPGVFERTSPSLLFHHHNHKAHYCSSHPVQKSSVFWILRCHVAPPL